VNMIYPLSDGATYDADYHQAHGRDRQATPAVDRFEIDEAIDGPYFMIGQLYFESAEALPAADGRTDGGASGGRRSQPHERSARDAGVWRLGVRDGRQSGLRGSSSTASSSGSPINPVDHSFEFAGDPSRIRRCGRTSFVRTTSRHSMGSRPRVTTTQLLASMAVNRCHGFGGRPRQDSNLCARLRRPDRIAAALVPAGWMTADTKTFVSTTTLSNMRRCAAGLEQSEPR
jgi:hypothetical protein